MFSMPDAYLGRIVFCTARERLGTIFLAENAPSNKDALFFILNAATCFLQDALTKKTPAIVCKDMTVRLVPLLATIFSGLNTF